MYFILILIGLVKAWSEVNVARCGDLSDTFSIKHS